MTVPTEEARPSPYVAVARSALRGSRVTALGIGASAVLAAIKILCGIFGNAYVLIADGVESILDIFSSLVVLGSLRIAATPPNERFPFGYGKIEPFGGVVMAVVLLATAVAIAFESVREIMTPHHGPAAFTLVVLLGVVAVKEFMFRRLRRTGEKIGSTAVLSDAWHHRSDAITSVAAFIGISIALVGGPGYERADDWAALAACVVIAFNGVRLFRTALAEILDVKVSDQIENEVRSVSAAVEGVCAIDKCRIRKSGLGYFIDIHVVVDGDITVRRGHAIGHEVKDALLASDLGILDVAVHVEPLA
ncbi:MAG TPA: cation diffusion facilitator family transporter [Pirellulales bacterium]|nr:cation diffusion facilitator family transporter [Pirellulales bacterium]